MFGATGVGWLAKGAGTIGVKIKKKKKKEALLWSTSDAF